MDQQLETIDLDVEEPNELCFKVSVEGADPAPARVRLVCESDKVSYMFSGRPVGSDGTVSFQLPVMKNKLEEGTYTSRIEVLVENRYFSPVQFQINFKRLMKVVAEVVSIPQRRAQPEIRVTAKAVDVVRQQKPKETQETKLEETSLASRYRKKSKEKPTTDENIIREIARSFIKKRLHEE